MQLRETESSFHRPEVRRLINLTNNELSELFRLRSNAVANALASHVFWDNPRIVYWTEFTHLQDRLYEVMMEIQSRYPKAEVRQHRRLLPVMEPNNNE